MSRDIATEEAKQKEWSLENVRRKHNYIPFIYNLVKKLAKKGMHLCVYAHKNNHITLACIDIFTMMHRNMPAYLYAYI